MVALHATPAGAQEAAGVPQQAKITKPPLKVYILAGQSNMQGHASLSTFDALADDPKTVPLLKEMRGTDGKPRVCDNVWISSIGCLGDAYADMTEAKGRLTTGFGAPDDKIGPEFTFGLTMEKALKEPILIIKTSWGGRSLHTDFRPPSAGAFAWREGELAERKKNGEDIEKLQAEKVAATGLIYRAMIDHVRMVLKDIKRVVPDHDDKQGCELAGFVWFQGFNDYVDGGIYPEQDKPNGYDMYADLLGNFIRDVRKDLAAPNMPFVVGVMGIDGLRGDRSAPMMHFRAAQRKPSGLAGVQGQRVHRGDGRVLGRRAREARRAHGQLLAEGGRRSREAESHEAGGGLLGEQDEAHGGELHPGGMEASRRCVERRLPLPRRREDPRAHRQGVRRGSRRAEGGQVAR